MFRFAGIPLPVPFILKVVWVIDAGQKHDARDRLFTGITFKQLPANQT